MANDNWFYEPPVFLKLLGCHGFEYDIATDSVVMYFDVSKDFAHTGGTIIQGGFITAMLDTSMGHAVANKMEGKANCATLNISVNFLRPGRPGKLYARGSITQLGNTIAYTESKLYQEDLLVATATAVNKITHWK
ncbi:MAG: PaaI family thioesterase [Gammaproteobacteria bacterium]